MREEEASTSNTPAEICFKKVNGIPGNSKGVAAPKKTILAVENLRTEVSKEKKRAADAEARSTLLGERVAAQEQELNTLKGQMETVLAEITRLAGLGSRETVSAKKLGYFLILVAFM